MKGTFCDKDLSHFCQEDSGCDNCSYLTSKANWQARIEIHNLKQIDVEPRTLAVLKDVYLPELSRREANFIRDNAPQLLGGFAITVTYTKEE